MGNWHCVTSSCAEVHYREYEPAKIRWRYGSEAWQEIIGANDYSTDLKVPNFTGGQCEGGYRVWCRWDGQRTVGRFIEGKITSVFCSVTRNSQGRLSVYNIQVKNNKGSVVGGANHYTELQSPGSNIVEIESYPAPNNCGDLPTTCDFKVFKNNVLVYQETRSTCPEVEKIPCTLSTVNKVIEVNKLPYLERVEVVPYAYLNFGLNVFQAPIPSNCLNIYNNLTTTIIPLSNGFPTPSNASQATYNFVDQICSYPGCPPPQFDVICDCQCQSCPGDTCPIQCGDHVCCYNDYGVSVQSIPLSDYCGGNS
jgi:hypothetical protein